MDTQQITLQPQIEQSILIVEDEKDYRDVLVERFEKEGFKVLQAENGELALKLLKNTDVDIDIILLDLLMPQMDGVTFFYHMKKTLGKSIPVVILTNYTEAAFPEGVTDFIIKANTSLDEVVKKVKKNIPIKV